MNLDHIRKIFYLNEKSFRLETRKRSVHFSARLWIPVFVAIALVLVALAKPLGITETQALPLLATMNVILILVSGGFLYMLNKRRMAESHEAAGSREERKLMTRLEESGERYRTLADNLLTPVIIFQGSRIKFANRLFYSLSGYTPKEVINEDFDVFSVVHEDDRPLVMAAAAQMLDGEKLIEPREIKFVKKSGEVMTGLTFSSVIRFEGKPAIETMVVDVTLMKQMEQELGSTKERLQYLLDTAPIMMFQLDGEGRFLYANNETLRTTGYRPDEWEGKSFAPIVHPEDLPLAMSKFEEGRKGTKRRDYKLRIINAKAELKVLYINARTIREDGRFAGSLIIARDVTEQLRLEETVKEARDHLANIIENAGDAIITLDIEGRVVSWNSSAESMFRLTRAEAAGQSLCSLPESDSGELAQLLDHVARGQTVRDREIEHTLKDGTRLNALFTFSPIRDATGNVAGISCFAKDITERRHLEKQLEVDKDFIDQLIENANAMIAVVNEEGKLIVFNRRFEEVTGFRKEEALGKDPMDVYVPEESREIVYRSVRKIRQGKPVLELEVPIVSNEGKPLIVTWSGAAVKLPSGQDGIVVVGQDVTEQKRMHEELVQSKKLTSIGELVSGVAHELNNPLTVVMGYSQLLTTEQKLSKKHREMGQKILEAAARSKRIVENLLAFARKRKLEKHEVDVNEIMENTLSLREHNLTVNNVRIIRKYDEKLPPTYADGHQLQQVFLNLINNAFDAMHDAHQRGTLEVKTYKNNGRIMVEVIDDGPGIPASMQDKIFDPFFTTKEVGKGTGLGMSLSYGIIKEHGGRIYLDKTYHRGAKFIIELPMTATPSPTGAK